MKVLMINPPYNSSKYKFIGLVAPTLGIAYIAAMLEKNGITVKILDAPALEIGHEAVINEIQKYSPDIVAVTSVTPTIESALKTAKISKEACPNAVTVLGGYHPTFTYQEVLKNDFVDIVVCGEGELTMVELVDSLENGKNLREVKGIATKDFKTLPRGIIKDLDSIPFHPPHFLQISIEVFDHALLMMRRMNIYKDIPFQIQWFR